ncbi:methyl-accepting chemotaxis protein [Pokkaliibacter sp. MBI-7]|uniref:methyl-accepting chemotaxis protein n=1 Tax=Pokkaliibacter sp. MBI-7 TaxID=3040600 RepID=UPI00244995DA|nr:methyl-accepting chemotaxis protein [Pokkaliibacter sp. MBI-7]MDH2431786.1 methyl-accepting chemotaxis protein [Pokkaliibacter sp. MBI-7]
MLRLNLGGLVIEQGRTTGYMSVRSQPDARQVASTEALYADIRKGKRGFPATRYQQDTPLMARIALLTTLPSLLSALALVSGGIWPWLGGLGGAATAVGLGIWTWTGVLKPMQRIGMALRQFAAGDLRFELDTRAAGEFAQLLIGIQSMKVNLRALFADMSGIARHVESQSNALYTQVEDATQDILRGSDGISMIASAVEQMSASVSEIAGATRQSADQATATVSQVNRGLEQIEATQRASQDVVERMHRSQSLIAELESEVASIRQLAEGIKGIADQTNLLALNAAIEAARAGESGRGFAVVADEVRKLAERTSNSTVEIAATVERIDSCTSRTLTAIADAATEVELSNNMMNGSKQTYDAIKESADDIQSSSCNIATTLDQQASASAEVASRVEQISMLVDQQSRSVESIHKAASQLGNSANQLHQMTSRFEQSF